MSPAAAPEAARGPTPMAGPGVAGPDFPKAGKPTGVPKAAPVPPPVVLHRELIPRDIAIVRCYYAQPVAAPGSSFEFDVNGSGFTAEFEKMIRVETGAPDVSVGRLRLVTANQIHGKIALSPDAKTQFIFPRVAIRGKSVFQAPEPFGIVRKGEVLHFAFTQMAHDGRSGRFRIITNLDEELARDFHVVASTPGLEISNLTHQLPFYVEGTLNVTPPVGRGAYGLTVKIGDRVAFRRDDMVHVVLPNLGKTGLVQDLAAPEAFLRPGDRIRLILRGSGFSSEALPLLGARVEGFDMGPASFTFISAGQIGVQFTVPANAPLRAYDVIIEQSGQFLVSRREAFRLVPENWIARLELAPPISPGGKSVLRIIGRDFSEAFARGLALETETEGVELGRPARVDDKTLAADIFVSSSIAPDDYLLTLTLDSKPIRPEYGSLIRVQPK